MFSQPGSVLVYLQAGRRVDIERSSDIGGLKAVG
jgi:hypothetical protein